MKWKYYIPHVWDSPEQRTKWEDVWLLPEDAIILGDEAKLKTLFSTFQTGPASPNNAASASTLCLNSHV